MSIKTFCLFPLMAVLFIACGGTKKENTQQPATPEQKEPKEESFIPYVSLLNDQIAVMDSTPLAIYKYTTHENGKTDTTFIQREEFHQLAKSFLEPDITSPVLNKQYTASSFGDKTTNLANFIYETKNPANEVQRVSIRFKPGETSKLTSLDIIKTVAGKTQKLFWKSNRFFHIVTDAGNGKYTRVEVAWNIGSAEPEVEAF